MPAKAIHRSGEQRIVCCDCGLETTIDVQDPQAVRRIGWSQLDNPTPHRYRCVACTLEMILDCHTVSEEIEWGSHGHSAGEIEGLNGR